MGALGAASNRLSSCGLGVTVTSDNLVGLTGGVYTVGRDGGGGAPVAGFDWRFLAKPSKLIVSAGTVDCNPTKMVYHLMQEI